LHFPDAVAALVPICGSYGRPLTTFHDNAVLDTVFPYVNKVVQRFPRAAKAVWRRVTSSRLAYEFAVRTEVNGAFIAREDFMPYFEHLAEVDPSLFFRMLADLNEHDLADRLDAIRPPTLIVAGERDTFTPAWISRKMHERIPASEFLFVPGGSHTAPIEFPELINLRIEKFLRERLPPKTAAAQRSA
jgi:pimeloyl-ACP methyl ester carboxylesterase